MNDSQRRNEQIARALCDWFVENCRELPFRQTRDAYCIWISEIMAQQTRISALIPYYERFVQRFPTVQALAAAEEDDVLRAWQGLGYYSRARNLHKAAQRIVREFDGQLPRTRKALEGLPGIGAYTAGAILSIAYDLEEPAIDGNALRVFARIEADESDSAKPQTQRAMAQHVREVMRGSTPSIFTQAVMELGALICLPTSPKCLICPVRALCCAREQGKEEQLPVKSAARAPRVQPRYVLLLQNAQGAFLLRRRTERLLHNLWEFPGFDDEASLCAQLQAWGVDLSTLREGIQARHVFTHIVWQMQGMHAHTLGFDAPSGMQWATAQQMSNLAMPTALKAYIGWAQDNA